MSDPNVLYFVNCKVNVFPQQNISHYQPILVKFCLLSITGTKTNNARQTHHKIYCCHQPYPQSKQFVQSVLRNSPCLSIRGCVPYTGNIICFITHIICTKILFFLPSIFLIAGKIIVSVWQVVSINKIRNKIRSSRHDNIIISRSTQSSIDIIYDGPSTDVSYHTSDTSININLLFPVLAPAQLRGAKQCFISLWCYCLLCAMLAAEHLQSWPFIELF